MLPCRISQLPLNSELSRSWETFLLQRARNAGRPFTSRTHANWELQAPAAFRCEEDTETLSHCLSLMSFRRCTQPLALLPPCCMLPLATQVVGCRLFFLGNLLNVCAWNYLKAWRSTATRMCDKVHGTNSSSRDEADTPLSRHPALLLLQQKTHFCWSGCAVRLWSRQPREARRFLFPYEVARQTHAEMECTHWSEWAAAHHLTCFFLAPELAPTA